jgi:hypothetical protein
MARKSTCIYPTPVYVATITGTAKGTTEQVRMAFWSPKGKPIDVPRGRRLVSWATMGRTILASHVEHGSTIIPDIMDIGSIMEIAA